MVSQSVLAASAILMPNIGGYLASIPVRKNMAWYANLKKPNFGPPNWVFAPAWTYIYTALGYSSYLVWKNGGGLAGPGRFPLIIYGGHLLLNFAWTPIFFSMHKLQLSLCELYAVDLTAVLTGYTFYQIKPVTGWLFFPYFAWLAYATALTYSIVKRNPDGGEDVIITEIKEELIPTRN